ncbi:PREDICTED: cysteine-rich repeat secretory protein 39-like [Nicotiana attenuata]|uniref:Cysteine-rich repeat secretory protein 39 n=1 Tax=Nicotiana attenuata TaxID=49451 RepID=A0A1J6IG11_NICAT|nr:PREDICTED: cysteine-rich repeat secretory protein 39-like [Nicotiana attenuata]OIT03324.1 cysteine-rich repeat secretory protein 39 [Nicotiana attenuata]
MGCSSSNPSAYLHNQFLLKIFLFSLMLLTANTNNIDFHQLVFTTCTANQTFQNDLEISTSLSKLSIVSSLFQEFLDKSSESKFFETYAGDDRIAILGLFQCRNDLNHDQCHTCTNKLVDISSNFCGERIPARVQLSGCYLDYKAEEEREVSKLLMLHKVCSRKKAKSIRYEEEMGYAFAEVESCGMSGNGFCDLSYGKAHVMAQCVGNLRGCDCGECMNKAVQIAHDECAYSIAAEVYLDGCYLSYSYGKHKISSYQDEGKGSGKGTQKLVAIVAGGIVATILLGIVYYFMKSWGKKDDDW